LVFGLFGVLQSCFTVLLCESGCFCYSPRHGNAPIRFLTDQQGQKYA
jgi:hypothetical protein